MLNRKPLIWLEMCWIAWCALPRYIYVLHANSPTFLHEPALELKAWCRNTNNLGTANITQYNWLRKRWFSKKLCCHGTAPSNSVARLELAQCCVAPPSAHTHYNLMGYFRVLPNPAWWGNVFFWGLVDVWSLQSAEKRSKQVLIEKCIITHSKKSELGKRYTG